MNLEILKSALVFSMMTTALVYLLHLIRRQKSVKFLEKKQDLPFFF